MEEWFNKNFTITACKDIWIKCSKSYKQPVSREPFLVHGKTPQKMHDCNLLINVNIFIPDEIMQYYFWGKVPASMGDHSYCFCENGHMYWYRSYTNKMVYDASFLRKMAVIELRRLLFLKTNPLSSITGWSLRVPISQIS